MKNKQDEFQILISRGEIAMLIDAHNRSGDGIRMAWLKDLLAVPAAQPVEAVDVFAAVTSEDGRKSTAEVEAWESYARGERLDMSEHPLHYLFLDPATNAARRAWRAALNFKLAHPRPTSAQPKLIGWRMADYTHETDSVETARNWSSNVAVLPIFEGDPNTKLVASPEVPRA